MMGAAAFVPAMVDDIMNTSQVFRDDIYWHANKRQQDKYAKNSAGWRLDDLVKSAERNGVHKLAALGVNGMSFSPQAVGKVNFNSGQNLSRAMQSVATERDRGYTDRVKQLTLDRMELENEILEGQKNNVFGPNQPQNPPMSSGAGNTIPGAEVIPNTVTVNRPGTVSDAGYINDVGFVWTGTGYAMIPSKDIKERIEDDFIAESAHKARMYMKGFKQDKSYKPSYSDMPDYLKKQGYTDFKYVMTYAGPEWRPIKSRKKITDMPSHLSPKSKKWEYKILHNKYERR